MAPAQMMERLSAAEAERNALRDEVAQLRAQLEWFKRNLFGTGKSEKIDALQTRLGLAEEAAEEPEAKKQIVTYERSKPAKRKSAAEQFEHLPVGETIEILPDAVKANPELYERIGIAEETFEVRITPAKLWKLRFVRPKFRYKLDGSLPPLLAPAPKRVIEGGYASAQLIAYVALNKYLYHLPLYRQEKMSSHWGARISRKTMADWIAAVADWFNPIYGLMHRNLLDGGYVQADETPVNFMDPDQKKGKTTQGYLCVIGKPGSDVVFDWQLSRAHKRVTKLLEGFEGLLQSDGYEAYDSLAKDNGKLTRTACWAHVRRKFVDAASEYPQLIGLLLSQIGALYGWERKWRGRLSSVGRSRLRQACFQSHLRMIRALAERLARRCRPKSKSGEACKYFFGQWDALLVQLEHGEAELDNNLIENAIRPSAVGKKNFLFIGSPEAGQRSAIIYSIIVSCERHGIDPLVYMTDVLEKLPTMSNQDDLSPLLPSKWKERR
ncbi:MAG: IS66 family transposase [Verrucomicrobia bacterium]|jgi:transposase|nr:IS66 family transposase [Verrucomicrobiota bacterium]